MSRRLLALLAATSAAVLLGVLPSGPASAASALHATASQAAKHPASATGARSAAATAAVAADDGATSTTLTVTPSGSSVHGQLVRLRARVTTMAGSAVPTGTVTFFDGDTALRTSSLGASGRVGFRTRTLSTGDHQLRATYSGDQTYDSSSSQPVSFTVAKADTATTLTVPQSGTTRYGDPGVSARVRTLAPGRGTPAGTVEWYDGSDFVIRTPVNRGLATLPTTALRPGDHQLSARYSGDDDSATSRSGSTPLTVTKADQTVTAKVSPSSPRAGQQIVATATTTTSSIDVAAEGSISFDVDGAPAQGSVQGNGDANRLVLADGLPSGAHDVTVHYSGSDLINDASDTVHFVVN